MAANDEESEVAYTDAVIEQATESFFRDFFGTTYGRALMLAALVNVAAFVFIISVGVRDSFMLAVIGMIAAVGPVYLGVIHFYFPGKCSTALKERLKPSALITIGAAGFGISASGRTVKLLWSDVRRILEFSDYFILVFKVSRLAFTVIPKEGLPSASQQLIRDASRSHAA